jgi:signal transduction histidine kinase
MKLRHWWKDTIARRFIVTEVLAVGLTLALLALFNAFGGFWSQEPLDKSALFREVTEVLSMMEAASPQARPALAAAASTQIVHLRWYSASSTVADFFEARSRTADSDFERRVLALTHHLAETIDAGTPVTVPSTLEYDRSKPALPYVLALELSDRSWLVYTVPVRFWGVPLGGLWMIRILCFLLSIALVTAVAVRQFAKPVEQLADAARHFGIDPHAPSIAEEGPQELRQVARTFNAMQAQIQTFIAHRTTMLAAISHDMRTPLTRIRLRGELIEDPEQQARLFRDVDELQAMIDGALAFFRDDAIAEATTLFDLAELISTVINDYADQRVAIGYGGPKRAIYRGRPFALKRVLTNLTDNAIKYATPPDIALAQVDSAWIISVADRGPGIPDESLQSVFRPYHRLDKSRNRMTGGVGLGLSVAQAIVHGHGGEIVLNHRAGGGLIAAITLPIADGASGESSALTVA